MAAAHPQLHHRRRQQDQTARPEILHHLRVPYRPTHTACVGSPFTLVCMRDQQQRWWDVRECRYFANMYCPKCGARYCSDLCRAKHNVGRRCG